MIIRDPVHGDLAFTSIERRAMDTPTVQRLRGIRQTGTAYLVYPGCVHTRFEHSLGTSGMARRIMASIRANGTPISLEQESIVALAALLHDVSHLPFGHTFEDLRFFVNVMIKHVGHDGLDNFLYGLVELILVRISANEASHKVIDFGFDGVSA